MVLENLWNIRIVLSLSLMITILSILVTNYENTRIHFMAASRQTRGLDLMNFIAQKIVLSVWVNRRLSRIMTKLRKLLVDIRKNWKLNSISIVIIVLVTTLAFNHFVNGQDWADWTGFGSYNVSQSGIQRGKTLWDILDLLIVPLALAVIALWFNSQEKKKEQIRIEEKNRDEVLQKYYEKISELLLDYKLLPDNLDFNSSLTRVAQIHTVTALRQLDSSRQNLLIQFLRDSRLGDKLLSNSTMGNLTLKNVNLSGINLSNSYLNFSDLSGSLFIEANMTGVKMQYANLQRANLSKAKLIRADLRFSQCQEAEFSEADLSEADFYKASLDNAQMLGVNLTNTKCAEAKLRSVSLSGSDLINTDFYKADLTGADLCLLNIDKVNMRLAILKKAVIMDVNFKDANLERADFSESQLFSVDFSKASSSDGIKFDKAEMKDVIHKPI